MSGPRLRILDGGALLVDKSPGPTSHDAVARVRKSLGLRKVGHGGTLDPFATGLLVLLVGAGTRLAEYLSGLPKSYLATAVLGERTDTLDPEGEVVERDEAWRQVDEEKVRAALAASTGMIQQIPPQYSAKKVEGEAMYRKARRGEFVPLEPVDVRISDLELLEWSPPRLRFRVTCSAGTYIRALARDIGVSLGTCARLDALRRTGIGSFSVDDAIPLDGLDDRDRVVSALLGLREAVGHLPMIAVDAEAARRLAHGQSVPTPETGRDGTVGICLGDSLAAVGRIEDGMVRPRKVFLRLEGGSDA